MNEYNDSLVDSRIFYTLSANSNYWQVKVHESNHEKTEITSNHSSYQFTIMLFGIRSDTATFQRAMDLILSTVKSQHALVYLDDIVKF